VGESEVTSPSLADEQKQLTRDRIRRAAMEVVARRGFDATVEEIARQSGVSPRTIFRHYATQGSLILATVKDMLDACGRTPIEGLPVLEDDLGGWLDVLSVTIHTRSAEILGQAFWDIHAPPLEDSEMLAEVAALRRQSRRSGCRHLATITWRAAGGTGPAPEELVSAFGLNFSAFATQALMIDFDHTPAQVGTLTADILKMVLARSLKAQSDNAASGTPTPLTTTADEMTRPMDDHYA
jgi:AcrR family transcriptional regulator